MWLMRDVVLAAFNAVAAGRPGIGDDEVGPYIQFVGQQLPNSTSKPVSVVVFLEIEGRCISLKGNAQFATVVYVVNQFGMSQGAQKG